MKIGMLWFDNSPDPITQRVERATTYYLNKYNRTPNAVYVWAACPDAEIPGVTLHKSPYILTNHFWVGSE